MNVKWKMLTDSWQLVTWDLLCHWLCYVTESFSHCLHPLFWWRTWICSNKMLKQPTNKIMRCKYIRSPRATFRTALPTLSANQARQAKLYFHQLSIFSLSHQDLTLFLESCYDASILFAPDKTKTLARSLSFLHALAVWNWTTSIPDCIMFGLSSPSPLFRFLAYGSPLEVLAWEASGCSNDTVFTKLPSQGRHSPYRVSYHGPLDWWLIRATLTVFPSVHSYNIWGTCGQRTRRQEHHRLSVSGVKLRLSFERNMDTTATTDLGEFINHFKDICFKVRSMLFEC